MAVSKVETQVTWSSANTKTLNTNNWVVSDEITLNDSDWEALVYCRGDNQSTPSSGDTVEIRVLHTAGDVDNGGGANDYPDMNASGSSGAQAPLLGVLDTYNNYDPDTITRPISLAGKSTVKFAARAPQGATRSIVLAMRINTVRGAIA